MRWTIGLVAATVVIGLSWAGWTAAQAPSTDPTPAVENTPANSSGPSPDATPVAGSEVLPPDSPVDAGTLPPRDAATPRISQPLPAAASGEEFLVDGYPTDIAGPIDGATVVTNSIASEGSTLQAALRARTDEAPSTVAERYRDLWADRGLVPAGGTALDFSFADAFTSVSIAVSQSGTGTVFAVYATLRAE